MATTTTSPSFAKANYPPYGMDFNGGPTGRFSSGYTMVDEPLESLISLQITEMMLPGPLGSNDYLNNYLMPNYDTRNHYNAQQFADLLAQHLTRLYNLGARKFVIAGVGRMGCIPSILAALSPNGRQ
ncbi:hypothetical protein ACLB2K_037025 [Fragaria x ananassa]